MEWCDLDCFLCASLAYPNATFVTKVFESINFLAPATLGDILRIMVTVDKVGMTSITLRLTANNVRSGKAICSTSAVFVNVVDGVKMRLVS